LNADVGPKTACLYCRHEVEFPGWCNPGARI